MWTKYTDIENEVLFEENDVLNVVMISFWCYYLIYPPFQEIVSR